MSVEASDSALLDDGRAMLATFLAGGWSSASIRVGESQFAFSRHETAGGLAETSRAAGAAGTPAAAQLTSVAAPHVGTIVMVAEVGSTVAEGALVASIAVLDEVFEIAAPSGGTVLGILTAPGTLVEFGQVVLELGH